MPLFQIAYWAYHATPWRTFTGAVEADGPREAMEKVGPHAAGRYRVTVFGSAQTAALFRVELTPHDDCRLIEVDSFPHLRALSRRP